MLRRLMKKSKFDLESLVVRAIAAFERLSDKEKRQHRRQQAISFVYGNLKLDGCDVTMEDVEKAYDEKHGEFNE